MKAIFKGPGSRVDSSRYGRSGFGMMYGAPASGPFTASSIAALSLTERVSTCSTAAPCHIWPYSGPVGLRPREGFIPKSPQYDAGMRMEPPPSPPEAKGTMPLATAAPDPPLEPPGVTFRFQGLRVGPCNSGSVIPISPNSGVLVLPRITTPVALYRFISSLSWAGM